MLLGLGDSHRTLDHSRVATSSSYLKDESHIKPYRLSSLFLHLASPTNPIPARWPIETQPPQQSQSLLVISYFSCPLPGRGVAFRQSHSEPHKH
jgi:hypothetical protein